MHNYHANSFDKSFPPSHQLKMHIFYNAKKFHSVFNPTLQPLS